LGKPDEKKENYAMTGAAADQAVSTQGKGLHLRYNRLPEKEKEEVVIGELVKSYQGTPIGISAANIFKMIKKRYEIKASQKVFFQENFQGMVQVHK
jgi:hypothetical protein